MISQCLFIALLSDSGTPLPIVGEFSKWDFIVSYLQSLSFSSISVEEPGRSGGHRCLPSTLSLDF